MNGDIFKNPIDKLKKGQEVWLEGTSEKEIEFIHKMIGDGYENLKFHLTEYENQSGLDSSDLALKSMINDVEGLLILSQRYENKIGHLDRQIEDLKDCLDRLNKSGNANEAEIKDLRVSLENKIKELDLLMKESKIISDEEVIKSDYN